MFCKNMEELYEMYDTFLIDMYGVLWNGRNFFDGALALLKKMQNAGKKVIILSNTTLTAEKCRDRYFSKGMVRGTHFDEFITSGEVLKRTVKKHFSNAKTYFPAFHCNTDIFDGSGLDCSQSIELSDFVFIGNGNFSKHYFADCLQDKHGKAISVQNLTSIDYRDIADFDEISSFIDLCLKFNKTLVIANSDLFAIEAWKPHDANAFRPILCQGYIGSLYENAGGKVMYFGKPYSVIFDYAKQFFSSQDKVAMVGDTPWTDILGGNKAGMNTILTLSGVAQMFIKEYSEDEICNFIECISYKMVHSNMRAYLQTPTHIIERFA